MIVGQGGRHSAEHVAAQIALGDELIAGSKEIQALGAFNAAERTTALDLLGFQAAAGVRHLLAWPCRSRADRSCDAALRRAAAPTTAHMAEFCGDDPRLLGVAVVPLDDPDLAMAELDAAIELGLRGGLGAAPARAATARPATSTSTRSGRGWPRAGVPFVLHVGGAPLQMRHGLDEHRPPAPTRTGWAAARTCAPRTSPCCTSGPRPSSR